jgi:hypothetical protein
MTKKKHFLAPQCLTRLGTSCNMSQHGVTILVYTPSSLHYLMHNIVRIVFIKDICVTKKTNYITVIHKFNIIEINSATPKFLQQNIHMVSYDHQGFDSNNNYILANSNFGVSRN